MYKKLVGYSASSLATTVLTLTIFVTPAYACDIWKGDFKDCGKATTSWITTNIAKPVTQTFKKVLPSRSAQSEDAGGGGQADPEPATQSPDSQDTNAATNANNAADHQSVDRQIGNAQTQRQIDNPDGDYNDRARNNPYNENDGIVPVGGNLAKEYDRDGYIGGAPGSPSNEVWREDDSSNGTAGSGGSSAGSSGTSGGSAGTGGSSSGGSSSTSGNSAGSTGGEIGSNVGRIGGNPPAGTNTVGNPVVVTPGTPAAPAPVSPAAPATTNNNAPSSGGSSQTSNPSRAAAPPAVEYKTIGGIVKDYNGAGVANYSLSILRADLNDPKTVTTGADGKFSLSGFVPKGVLYAVRPQNNLAKTNNNSKSYISCNNVNGNTANNNPSFECQLVDANDCGDSCNFLYKAEPTNIPLPLDVAYPKGSVTCNNKAAVATFTWSPINYPGKTVEFYELRINAAPDAWGPDFVTPAMTATVSKGAEFGPDRVVNFPGNQTHADVQLAPGQYNDWVAKPHFTDGTMLHPDQPTAWGHWGSFTCEAPAYTTSYRVAESPADLDAAAWINYTQQPQKITYHFKDPNTFGAKVIFVQFKDNKGKVSDMKSTTVDYRAPKVETKAAQSNPTTRVASPSPSASPSPVQVIKPVASTRIYGAELLPADMTANFSVKVAQLVHKLEPGKYRVTGTINTNCGSIQTDIWKGTTFVGSVPTSTDFTVEEGQIGYSIVRANSCDANYSNFTVFNLNGTATTVAFPASGKLSVGQKIRNVSGPGIYQLSGTALNPNCGKIQMDIYKGTTFDRNVVKITEAPISVTLANDENAYAIFRAANCDARFTAGSLKKAQ